MNPETAIQILISVLLTVIMYIVQTNKADGQRDRTEILSRLGAFEEKQISIDTRLSILENDFADIDPHPSRHRRPN